MSRIGKQPIAVPSGVKVQVAGQTVTVEGPKGRLVTDVPAGITARYDDGDKQVVVERGGDQKKLKALHGLARALIANNVLGVVEGYSKSLEIVGVGYNARVQGNKLLLTVGFANTVEKLIPQGVQVDTPTATQIVVSGPDKQKVGHFAAEIRKVRPPEPYKGKGIRFKDEVVRRKAGKAFAGGASA